MASPPNPVAVPIVSYEYLFCLPSSERPRSPIRWKARGLLSGSCTPTTAGHRLQPNKSRYDPILSHDKWLGNQIPRIRYGPTTPG
jgi:hypothetical protein